MGQRIPFAPQEFYHLYNRGTEKRNIFSSGADRDRFMALLYLSNGSGVVHISNYRGASLAELLTLDRGEPLIDIGAYCLMPNHFHILARERSNNGISRFMQKITTGYTMYFNTRYERSGALFQGKFKARHAGNDRYLKYLISYIHLNPIKLIEPKWKESGIANRKRAEEYLDTYSYSSYADYCGVERAESAILERATLPAYFESADIFKRNIADWLDYSKDIKVRP